APVQAARFARAAALLLAMAGAAQASRPSAEAQQRGAPPPGTPGAQPPGGQRGGGRGRGGVQVMTLSSTAWPDGGQIPVKHTQAGDEISPPLTWSGAPDGVASYVLVMHDVDAAIAPGTDDVLHWMVWNIPGSATGLPEHVPRGAQLPDGARQISAT